MFVNCEDHDFGFWILDFGLDLFVFLVSIDVGIELFVFMRCSRNHPEGGSGNSAQLLSCERVVSILELSDVRPRGRNKFFHDRASVVAPSNQPVNVPLFSFFRSGNRDGGRDKTRLDRSLTL